MNIEKWVWLGKIAIKFRISDGLWYTIDSNGGAKNTIPFGIVIPKYDNVFIIMFVFWKFCIVFGRKVNEK